MIGCIMMNEPFVDEIEKKWNESYSSQQLAKLKCVNDKYLDIIQAKNMNESFLESEIVSLKQQLEKPTEMIGHVVYDYERLISSKVDKIETLEQELQKTREHLGKAIKSAEFFMSHADCKKDSWACKCSFCRDTESSKNLRETRQYFKDKQGE